MIKKINGIQTHIHVAYTYWEEIDPVAAKSWFSRNNHRLRFIASALEGILAEVENGLASTENIA